MDDYRVRVGFLDHPKTMRLKRRLGPEAVEYVLRLWEFCTENPSRRNGDLAGLDAESIADVCRAQCDPHALSIALLECGFLEEGDNGLCVHGWRDNNAYVATWEERSKKAKLAASARWKKRDAGSMPVAMPDHESGNAPSPSPSPSPSPNTTSPEQKNAPADSEVFLIMPTKERGNQPYFATRTEVDKLKARYPNLDVETEFSKMLTWLEGNKKRLKTLRGMPRFISQWLIRAVSDQQKNNGGRTGAAQHNYAYLQPLPQGDDPDDIAF